MAGVVLYKSTVPSRTPTQRSFKGRLLASPRSSLESTRVLSQGLGASPTAKEGSLHPLAVLQNRQGCSTRRQDQPRRKGPCIPRRVLESTEVSKRGQAHREGRLPASPRSAPESSGVPNQGQVGVALTYVGYKIPHYEEYEFEWPLVLLWWLIYFAIVMPTILIGAYQVYDIVFVKGGSWNELIRPTALWGPAEDALQKVGPQTTSVAYRRVAKEERGEWRCC
ncbi:unnamed protein product [Cyprideis torosa]|uniref:Uncharacterized protein n=1 Tax=Cyprideis torosa TaxID=163714 RepID=A0A7R8WSN6_9CRUS|nr:unnamed protein product [Cyprideis torosa]CAG0905304.1 unnamed protein product [Cyprideis torosa]